MAAHGLNLSPLKVTSLKIDDGQLKFSGIAEDNVQFIPNFRPKTITNGKWMCFSPDSSIVHLKGSSYTKFTGTFGIKCRVNIQNPFGVIFSFGTPETPECFTLWGYRVSCSGTNCVLPADLWPLEAWNEFVVTRDDEDMVRMYANGIQVCENRISGTIGSDTFGLTLGDDPVVDANGLPKFQFHSIKGWLESLQIVHGAFAVPMPNCAMGWKQTVFNEPTRENILDGHYFRVQSRRH